MRVDYCRCTLDRRRRFQRLLIPVSHSGALPRITSSTSFQNIPAVCGKNLTAHDSRRATTHYSTCAYTDCTIRYMLRMLICPQLPAFVLCSRTLYRMPPELIVHQNEQVMSVGEALASAAASELANQQLRALEILEQQISEYTSVHRSSGTATNSEIQQLNSRAVLCSSPGCSSSSFSWCGGVQEWSM